MNPHRIQCLLYWKYSALLDVLISTPAPLQILHTSRNAARSHFLQGWMGTLSRVTIHCKQAHVSMASLVSLSPFLISE